MNKMKYYANKSGKYVCGTTGEKPKAGFYCTPLKPSNHDDVYNPESMTWEPAVSTGNAVAGKCPTPTKAGNQCKGNPLSNGFCMAHQP